MSQNKKRKIKIKVEGARDSSISAAGGSIITNVFPDSGNPTELRKWWHSILRKQGNYKCYGIMLVLPSDENAIQYLINSGSELDIISGENCLIIALSDVQVRSSEFDGCFQNRKDVEINLNEIDEESWSKAINEQVSKGYSIRVAKTFGIPMTKFPCLVIFQDIRSPGHVLVSFKDMKQKEISKKMRSIFSIVQHAITHNENPIKELQKYQNQEDLQLHGKSVIESIGSFGGKTLEIAMEAWLKSLIK